MARRKEPLALAELKGTNHMTKAEKEKRKNEEIQAPADNIVPPDYLTKEERVRFGEIAQQLADIGIMANLDAPALARYVTAETLYTRLTRALRRSHVTDIAELSKLLTAQDKVFKQCRAAAADLGMTITSRCRIVIPKAEEKPTNRFEIFRNEEDTSVG